VSFFNPKNAVENTAVDYSGVIVASRIGKFSYANGDGGEQTALQVVIKNEETGRLRSEDWNVGKSTFLSPTTDGPTAKERTASETGNFVMRTRDGAPVAGLPKGCIANQIVEIMLAAGLPETELAGTGADTFTGLRFQWGLGKTKLATGGESAKSRLVPTAFHGRVKVEAGDYFAQAAAQRAGAQAENQASSTTPEQAAVVASPAAVVDEAFVQGLVIETITEAGGSIKKSDLSSKVISKVQDAKTRTAVVKLVLAEAFLKQIPGVAYDGKSLTVAA
jgi:hypothetical protein